MSRDICIYQEFLTDAHKAQIEAAARETGFVPHYFTLDQFEEAKACLQNCEILYAHSVDMLRAAPATLKWYCCSFAGVDPYCKDPSIFANPDCILTNSNGYGVTIAEHVVMVLLMLLRRMPEYEEVVRNRGWSNQLPIRSIRDNEYLPLPYRVPRRWPLLFRNFSKKKGTGSAHPSLTVSSSPKVSHPVIRHPQRSVHSPHLSHPSPDTYVHNRLVWSLLRSNREQSLISGSYSHSSFRFRTYTYPFYSFNSALYPLFLKINER